MRASEQKKVAALKERLKPGEQVAEVGVFRCSANIALFFAIAIASLVAGRIFSHNLPVVLLTNLLSMWMMVDAAQALYSTQNSCLLVTDRRTFGMAGGKEFDLPHRKLHQLVQGRVVFLDGGDAHSSVVLKNLSNRTQVCQAINRFR